MLLLYAVTLLFSAGLLFAIEPLFAKSLLPVVGGTAMVWTTSAAFFQTALLCGYLYAHALRRWLGSRAQALVHFGVVVVVFFMFPVRGPSPDVVPTGMEALWLFVRLGSLVGAPFIIISATAPLMQHWFNTTRHGSSRDPYFLYAASNAGSLLGLLSYPLVVEPLVGLSSQRRLWTTGFAALVGMIGACAFAVWRAQRQCEINTPVMARVATTSFDEPAWRDRLRWVALSAIPSSLLLSVTNYVTADVAAIPLLWVGPLAIYLVTFILAFSKWQWISRERVSWLQPFLLVPVFVGFTGRLDGAAPALLALHGVAFFVIALSCYQTLVLERPAPRSLTEYYVWISVGVALGALFNVIVAPLAFSDYFEYPLGISIAGLLTCRRKDGAPTIGDLAFAVGIASGFLGAAVAIKAVHLSPILSRAALASAAGVGGIFVLAMRERPFGHAWSMAALACVAFSVDAVTSGAKTSRSFYGVHTVIDRSAKIRQLVYGNTVHGAQALNPERRREPLTYYHRTGPIGQFLSAWRGRSELRRVGVVGLGTGSLAAYSEPGEHWKFFEIDPEIVKTARDRGLFSFLPDARGRVEVTLGDARQTLQTEPDGSFGVLILDAFSSDSIPSHLLTREALDLYLRKLRPSGVIAVHVSNRYLDVASVVAATAHSCGAVTILQRDAPSTAEEAQGKAASHWMLIARSWEALSSIASDHRWSIPPNGDRVWTDDFTSVWTIMHLVPDGRAIAADG